MLSDPWLQRWLPLLREQAVDMPVLEIGCGPGDDTATLAAAGLDVTAFDISADAVAAARRRAPAADIRCQDIRDPFPLGAGTAGAVVASLSLHYFPWQETLALVERVHRTLRPGGLLLCRLNSTEDRHFGATGHPAIEPHYYRVDGQPKRFFDAADLDRLFTSGWERIAQEHLHTRKYLRSKALWETVLRRTAPTSG